MQYAKQLQGEYRNTYKEIEGTLSFMSGNRHPVSSIINDIVDLLLIAQTKNNP